MEFAVIDNNLSDLISSGNRKFVIYPFGEFGFLTKQILNQKYGIQEEYIIDKNASKVNENIKSVEFLDAIDCREYIFLVASKNYFDDIEAALLSKQLQKSQIIDLLHGSNKKIKNVGVKSYGSLAKEDNPLIESIGAFCSFAQGAAVVSNHVLGAVTNHPFLYSTDIENSKRDPGTLVTDNQRINLFDEAINRKVRIGNDVWLGQNVIITSGVMIGNGVIAGAGAVITKDVPDYAVVVGSPARIIRYRFTPEQIEKLNKIKWWDWELDKIRDCYDDFFDIDVFLKKHGGKD